MQPPVFDAAVSGPPKRPRCNLFVAGIPDVEAPNTRSTFSEFPFNVDCFYTRALKSKNDDESRARVYINPRAPLLHIYGSNFTLSFSLSVCWHILDIRITFFPFDGVTRWNTSVASDNGSWYTSDHQNGLHQGFCKSAQNRTRGSFWSKVIFRSARPTRRNAIRVQRRAREGERRICLFAKNEFTVITRFAGEEGEEREIRLRRIPSLSDISGSRENTSLTFGVRDAISSKCINSRDCTPGSM